MSDSQTQTSQAKSAARSAGIAARQSVGAGIRRAASAALCTALAPYHGQTIAGYMPMRAEADPLPAMMLAAAQGVVGVPVILAKAQPLQFRRWTPRAKMVPGRFGALIPMDGTWVAPRVVIVPLTAFDRQGGRVGYGGGYYDRTLQNLRRAGPVTAIGFAYGAQEMPQVPLEPTDQPLDLIVTEEGACEPT